ncbi:Transcriptional regulator, AraC family [Desulfosporosinus sp. I2]|nr:Transcriptional regulator, AraC family [Desulfosporosinus sp. I2]
MLDVALKYGYETPEAFAKAFRKMHGMSPSAAREPGTNLKAFPKLSFHISNEIGGLAK